MNIKRIIMSRFLCHRHSTVEIPDTGIVAVTGDNGAGKSSVPEGVSWGLWGKLLRGSNPAPCAVTVETAELSVEREKGDRKKGRLDWSVGDESEEFENVTKSQEALESVIGPFALWRRTSVFSSQDAHHFTLASDGERKRLLEALLGLDKFDKALESCRRDLKGANGQLVVAETNTRTAEVRHAETARRLQDARGTLASLPEPVDLTAAESRLQQLREAKTDATEDCRRVQVALTNIRDTKRCLELDLRRNASDQSGLRGDSCPTCDQEWPDLVTRRKKLHALQGLAKSKSAELAALDPRDLEAELDDLREELDAIQKQGTELLGQVNATKSSAATRQKLEETINSAMTEMDNIDANLHSVRSDVERLETEIGYLKASEKVLGLKGVRAHVLGSALSGLETVANNWLNRIARQDGPLALKLSPYIEKKTGGYSDSIGLEVNGAGGGTGYKGASGGERRRIDVALLLALAEVAAAAHNKDRGTLFFDEVFDSLDEDGTIAVTLSLQELAQDRAVVVISHNVELIDQLGADIHYHVEKGDVRKV